MKSFLIKYAPILLPLIVVASVASLVYFILLILWIVTLLFPWSP
jgi:hypothetical protein